MLESEIQKNILDYLELRGICAWRTNAGQTRNNVKLAPKGTPDIIGYLPNGLFLGIEVKRPGKHPTDVQKRWMLKASSSGCVAFVAKSVEDVSDALDKL